MNRYAKKGFYDWQESIPIFLSPPKKIYDSFCSPTLADNKLKSY